MSNANDKLLNAYEEIGLYESLTGTARSALQNNDLNSLKDIESMGFTEDGRAYFKGDSGLNFYIGDDTLNINGEEYRLSDQIGKPSLEPDREAEKAFMESQGGIGRDIVRGVTTGLEQAGENMWDFMGFVGGKENVQDVRNFIVESTNAFVPEPVKEIYQANINQPIQKFMDETPQTPALQAIVQGFAEFGFQAFTPAKVLKVFAPNNPILRGLGWGYMADFINAQPDDQTLTAALVEGLEGSSKKDRSAFGNAILDAVKVQGHHSEFQRRSKMAVDGMIAGTLFEFFVPGLKTVVKNIPFNKIIPQKKTGTIEGTLNLESGKNLTGQIENRLPAPEVKPVATEAPVPEAEKEFTDIDQQGFYSAVSRAVDELPMDKGNAQQMRSMIEKSPNVKAEELQWTGLDEFLKGRKNVTKQEIQDYIDMNKVEIDETTRESYGTTGDMGEYEWDEIQIDDDYEAYRHRAEDITYELESGEDYYVDAVDDMLGDDFNLKEYLKGGEIIGELDDNIRYKVFEATDEIAKKEYMDNPYISLKSADGKYEIYGNDDIGYSIHRQGSQVRGSGDIYNLEEAKIQAQVDAQDYGYASMALDEGDTLFSEYTLPAGENYREVLLRLPTSGKRKATQTELERGYATNNQGAAVDVDDAGMVPDVPNEFRSGHFSEPNVVSHIRLTDRSGSDGESLLLIEEIQSDWHQKGRKRGYKTEQIEPFAAYTPNDFEIRQTATQYVTTDRNGISRSVGKDTVSNEQNARKYFANWLTGLERQKYESRQISESGKVPDAPLKKTWHEMSFRRVLRMAAEEGYDAVAWTPGKIQNERYNLSRFARAIQALKHDDGTVTLKYVPRGYKLSPVNIQALKSNVPDSELEDFVGKDLAEKIRGQNEEVVNYDGLDLEIGGSGMKGFYDKMLKNYAQKFGKKFDAKVGVTDINVGGGESDFAAGTEKVWKIPITKKMRTSLLKKGVPFFGVAGAATAGSEIEK